MYNKAEITKTTWDILNDAIFPETATVKLPLGITLTQSEIDDTIIVIKKPQEKIEIGNEICFTGTFDSESKKVTLIITDIKDTLNGNLKLTLNDTLQMTVTSAMLYQLNNVKIMHGTIAETNEKINSIKKGSDKYPLIFLHEVTGEKYYNAKTSSLERTSTIDLFFLTEANFEKWEQDEHYKYAIKPMRGLCNDFLQALRYSGICAPINDYEIIDHVKFGVYASEYGHNQKIFMDKLSGIQLKLSIDFLKGCCEKKKDDRIPELVFHVGRFQEPFDENTSIGDVLRVTKNLNNIITSQKWAYDIKWIDIKTATFV